MDRILTEKDLEMLFSAKKSKETRRKRLKRMLIYFLSPIFFVCFLYIGINYKSLAQNFNYWFQNEYLPGEPSPNSAINNNNSNNNSKVNGGTAYKPDPKPENLPEIPDNTINIPVINITAPISWGVKNTPENITDALSKGVAHVLYTSLPGETGNVFITGHSSNYPWAKGDYNNIFALLNKMVIGDMVQLKYEGQLFVYKVSETKVVNPDDVSVMYPTSEPVLSLMTCTPVGTNLRRLIVISKQIYPEPSKNVKSQAAPIQEKSMPKAR